MRSTPKPFPQIARWYQTRSCRTPTVASHQGRDFLTDPAPGWSLRFCSRADRYASAVGVAPPRCGSTVGSSGATRAPCGARTEWRIAVTSDGSSSFSAQGRGRAPANRNPRKRKTEVASPQPSWWTTAAGAVTVLRRARLPAELGRDSREEPRKSGAETLSSPIPRHPHSTVAPPTSQSRSGCACTCSICPSGSSSAGQQRTSSTSAGCAALGSPRTAAATVT